MHRQDKTRTRREWLILGGAAATAIAGCVPRAFASPTALEGTPTSILYVPNANGPLTGAATATPTATATVTPTPTATIPAGSLSCVVSPSLTEGPYFVDERLNRSDIRSDPSNGSVSSGIPLTLTIQVGRLSGSACNAQVGAAVDVWHCNAAGKYSDVSSEGTLGRKFLRGYQVTDANGQVNFTTIYPGWYTGRAVHIHFKVRNNLGSSSGYEFTSQWFFDDTLSDTVFTQSPYSAKGNRNTRNSNDGIYQQSGGKLTLATSQTSSGYAANFVIGLNIA